jgi:hypothetical protein
MSSEKKGTGNATIFQLDLLSRVVGIDHECHRDHGSALGWGEKVDQALPQAWLLADLEMNDTACCQRRKAFPQVRLHGIQEAFQRIGPSRPLGNRSGESRLIRQNGVEHQAKEHHGQDEIQPDKQAAVRR